MKTTSSSLQNFKIFKTKMLLQQLTLVSISCSFMMQVIKCEENNVAKEFLLALPETKIPSSGLAGDVELYIASTTDTGTNISLFLRENTWGVYDNFTIEYQEKAGYRTIPFKFRLFGSGIEHKSVLITADRNISLIVFNTERSSNDAFLALPTQALGQEYYVVTWEGAWPQFVISAIERTTRINITLPGSFSSTLVWNNSSFGREDVINVELELYETMQLQGDADLSGTHIVADARIAVLSGNKKTSIVNQASGDHLVEMMVPVNKWGKYFLIVATPNRESSDLFKIISSENSTFLSITSDTIIEETIEEAGNFFIMDFDIGSNVKIVADKPIMVTQFTPSRLHNREKSDPSMMLVVPVEQYDTSYTFPVYQTTLTSYIVITVKQGEEWGLMLDGRGMDLSGVKTIHDSGYLTFYNTIDAGAHTLNTSIPNSTFGAWLYGCGTAISYAVPAGMRLQSINERVNLTTNSSSSVSTSKESSKPANSTDCPCSCPEQLKTNITYTIENLEKKIKELMEALKIEKKSLSSFKRTKISAPDKRISSAAIGSILGIGVLSAITLMIVLPDIPVLGFHIFRFNHSTLNGKCNATV